MKKNKKKSTTNEEFVCEFVGKLLKWVLKKKADSLIKIASNDREFKNALNDFAKSTQNVKKILKNRYGVTSMEDLERLAKKDSGRLKPSDFGLL